MVKKLYRVAIGKSGLCDKFIIVLSKNKKSAEKQVIRKHLQRGQKILH